MSLFGDRIRAIRLGKNLSQREMAEIFNITQNAISKYEAGINEPSISFITAFCRHYGVSADYLLGLSNASAPIPQTVDLLRTSVNRDPFADLTPDQRTVIEASLTAFRNANAVSQQEA